MTNKINSNRQLTAGRVVFKGGEILDNVQCYITDNFLIVETPDERGTLYNLDTIDRIENVQAARPEPRQKAMYNCW